MTGWLPVVLGTLLAFVESIIGVGIFMPGEVMITALAATIVPDLLPPLVVAVVLGACLGDQLNYWAGRLFSVQLTESPLITRIGRRHWDHGVTLVQRHGAFAIVVSRLLPVVRTLVPAVAGVAHLSAFRFTLASLAGSLLWATVWLGAGTAAATVLSWSLLPLLVVVPAAIVFVLVSRRRNAAVTAVTEPAAELPG